MFDNEQTIQEITRRLVDFYHPVRVHLFGSVARGDSGPGSYLDCRVVVPDNAPGDVFRAGASRPSLAGISGPLTLCRGVVRTLNSERHV